MTSISVKVQEPIEPLVSVVIINWNYSEYVTKTIKSLKQQNYSNYEAFVIDNGSRDDSLKVIEESIGDDSRFKAIKNKENLGQLGAFLSVYKSLNGDFVVNVDADDILFLDFISKHLQVHMELKDLIGLTSSDVEIIDKDDKTIRHGYGARNRHKPEEYKLPDLAKVDRLSQINNQTFKDLNDSLTIHHGPAGWIWGPGTSNMYRKAILDIIYDPPKNTKWLRSSDNFLNPLVHGIAGSALIDQELSYYRIHDKNYYGTLSGTTGGRRSKEVMLAQRKDFYETADWWLARAGHFAPILKNKYWFVLSCLASYICIPSGKILPGTEDTIGLIKRNYSTLCEIYSVDVVNERLLDYFLRGDIFSAIGFVPSIMKINMLDRKNSLRNDTSQ